ncbi:MULTISPECIES: DUF6705 family protein [Chryseobacterium]|uniref:DUF6705 family protein n=1 Tax=Chryseobacterium TaxID=59732 RepID=UPI001552FB24|nr:MULTISPECIES: hypothetical protein [unclassified Chryseobacterium]MDC8106722.1 hypothetical protein [Chryseobacterium sp. B21-037]MDQ1806001.1 hypothetical protein [Chryseobacterium sp. CKR4-1]
MKTINIKTAILFTFLVGLLSCQAQQTYPLRTAVNNVPNLSHLKDTNNELPAFTGVYSASYNGRQITIYISKEEDKLFDLVDKKVYRDVLSIRYIVKNSTGTILQDTKNMNFQSNQYTHTIYSQFIVDNGGKAIFNYRGTNCRVGWGKINLKKISPTQLSWEYRPNDIILDSSKCPQGTDINIYLPETKDLIFTKQ